ILSRSSATESSKDASSGLYQILAPEGEITSVGDPMIPSEELLTAYRSMVLTRILDEKLIALQRQGRMGTYVSCSGQEASQVGSVMGLSKADWIFPMYRDLGMAVQAGVPMLTILNRMFGNADDELLGRDLPNLLGWRKYKIVSFAAPIASHLPLAAGFAMAAKIRKDDLVTLSTFGDGATSSGEFHIAMNFAGVYKAPTIFVCENNQYAISVPLKMQTASATIAIKARAYGFEGVRVDGNDIIAVYTSVKRAAEKARRGEGPTLIECVTYRLGAHSTSDDWKKYRSVEEVEMWRKRDPIQRLKVYLERDRKIWTEDSDAKLRARFESEISSSISVSERIPPPSVETLFEEVYSELPWNLKEQFEESKETAGSGS
ncbi:MAG: pyruvate dehydrogenase (acetyl-transferring) E1 component subunit alpha, partial [Nitrososphaerales archaeon]